VLPNEVAFDANGFALKPAARGVLDAFAGQLAADRAAQVTVVGHTDSTGSDSFNNSLSLDRAQSVRDYLVGRGISALQIRTLGRGKAEPLADNGSESGRARNRRTEIFVREASPA
jgi:outer membrane protein OmpA-like peptidoglycan-associated protein